MVEAPKPASSEPTVIDPFERFANESFYRQLNTEFVDSLDFKPGEVVLDLACGPGNIARLVAPKIGLDGVIFEVDPSDKAISAARRELGQIPVSIHYLQGRAEDLDEMLPNMACAFDKVICGNAVHNFSDKDGAFGNVFMLLKEGGTFGFNTSFYSGAIPEEEKSFYHRWIFRAARLGLKKFGTKARRGQKNIAEANPKNDVSPEEYVSMLRTKHFSDIEAIKTTVDMPLSGLDAISDDDEFLAGALPQLPPEVASDALKEALASFSEAGKLVSPRTWLTVIARKPRENGILEQAEKTASKAVDRELVAVA